jgi:ribonuclease G
MPENLIIVNRCQEETRVALIEHGQTRELIVEREGRRGILGNVYKGRVTRVLPGMQSAFVDVGLERTAFLYVSDIVQPKIDAGEGEDEEGEDEVLVAAPERQEVPIEQLIHEGQELLVQVAKEPIGTKGARLTTNLSLPGRNLVFLPGTDHVGVSRRIADVVERERLKAIATEIKPPEGGLIVRTAGEGKDAADFAEDRRVLVEVWRHILHKEHAAKAPALLYEDLDVVLKVIRDSWTQSFERVVVDTAEDHQRVTEFMAHFMPACGAGVHLHAEPLPVFEKYKVELELGRALDRKVWLKSGGYIVIDETEALTAIDVNTGRYVGKTNAEETILKINLEACKEIAYQLRLRNIGGIVVIDFIDMKTLENRERVYDSLAEDLARDRAKTHLLPMSELGLIEMTRKRVKRSLRHYLTAPCFYCQGKGYLKSQDVIATEILNRISKEALQAPPTKGRIFVYTHPDVMQYLLDMRAENIGRIEAHSGKDIVVRPRSEFHLEQFEVYAD